MPETKQFPAVTVFSTPTCPWCVRVKQYLDEQGVPQLYIGDEVVIGFDQARIDQLLDLS